MSGANGGQDSGSARIRHVPILIESRGGRPSDRLHNDGQARHQQQDDHQATSKADSHLQHHYHHPSFYGEDSQTSQTSPNTSTVNINYKPSLPQRPTQKPNQNPSANSGQATYHNQSQAINQQAASADHQRYNGNDREDRGEQASKKGGRRRNPSRNASPNSDKLVNSPEPIPLPPPQSDQSSKFAPDSNPSVNNSNNNSSMMHNDGDHHHEQQQQQEQQHHNQHGSADQQMKKGQSKTIEAVNNVKLQLIDLLPEIARFDGVSGKSKEYRYLDEMLTRCVLSLDQIECGDSAELRQQRKATIKLVDQATDILQRKLQLNSDIHNLSDSMATSNQPA